MKQFFSDAAINPPPSHKDDDDDDEKEDDDNDDDDGEHDDEDNDDDDEDNGDEKTYQIVGESEADIEKKYWMQIPAADQEKYIIMMRESRIALTNEGIYDKRMMSVLKKVRCQVEPSNAECAQKLE